jgi:hypothetical protein
MSAAEQIFKAICKHLFGQSDAVRLFAATGYSFEEWCNWEAFAACKLEGWTVTPKPRYSKFGGTSRGLGDLSVSVDDETVFVEIGLERFAGQCTT